MTSAVFDKKSLLSGKYEVAQYILGQDFKKKIGDNNQLQNLLNEELRLLEGFYGLAFDTELTRIRTFGREVAGPVYFLRRTVGFGKLFADEVDMEEGSLEIISLQIHKLEKMENTHDEKGNKEADYILNIVAHEAQIAIAEVQAGIIQDTDGEDIACRYTENEFVIILRNRSDQYRDKLSQKIQTKLSSINLDISIKIIKTPSDEEEKRIYIAFLKRAMILNKKQVSDIQKRMNKNDLDFFNLSIYPPEIKSIEEKVTFIIKIHPELATPLKIARALDGNETKERTELSLNFIENIFFNKTLGNEVHSFVDLQWHIAQGELSELWVLEFKFLKEINESLSIVDGDDVLQTIYKSMKSLISEEDRKNVILFQRGGFFVIATNDGSRLSPESRENLNRLQSVNIYSDTNLEIPVGRSMIELTRKGENETEEETIKRTYIDLNKALSLAETNWYYRMTDIMDDSREEYESLLSAEQWRVEEEMNESEIMTLSYLVWHFFHGKDGYYRSKKVIEVLKGRPELTQLFENIINQTTESSL